MNLVTAKQVMRTLFSGAIIAFVIATITKFTPLMFIMIGSFAAYITVYMIFWRCPHCKKIPGKVNAVKCRHCGKSLFH